MTLKEKEKSLPVDHFYAAMPRPNHRSTPNLLVISCTQYIYFSVIQNINPVTLSEFLGSEALPNPVMPLLRYRSSPVSA